jgi:hypothetical protein
VLVEQLHEPGLIAARRGLEQLSLDARGIDVRLQTRQLEKPYRLRDLELRVGQLGI